MSLEIADHAYVLDNGAIVHSGPARELARDEARVQALAGVAAGTRRRFSAALACVVARGEGSARLRGRTNMRELGACHAVAAAFAANGARSSDRWGNACAFWPWRSRRDSSS